MSQPHNLMSGAVFQRFKPPQTRRFLQSWGRIIHVLLDGRSLTMIGSGESATIIGPTTVFPITEHDKGIVLVNGAELYLSDVTIEHCGDGLECWSDSYYEVERCTFQQHASGTGCSVFSSRGARIANCRFLNYEIGVFPGSGLQSSVGVVVEYCEFLGMSYGINTTASQGLIVRHCRIDDSITGIQLWSNSTATLDDLDIRTEGVSLIVKAGSQAELSNSRLLGSLQYELTTVWILSTSSFSGSGNIIRGSESPAILVHKADVHLGNSHILTTSLHSVECMLEFPAEWTIDLRNNWWGVSDADSIDALIYDGNDDTDIGVIVQYLPFRDEQVANEAMGWGELKRLYR